jgi:hypothetical protein
VEVTTVLVRLAEGGGINEEEDGYGELFERY